MCFIKIDVDFLFNSYHSWTIFSLLWILEMFIVLLPGKIYIVLNIKVRRCKFVYFGKLLCRLHHCYIVNSL